MGNGESLPSVLREDLGESKTFYVDAMLRIMRVYFCGWNWSSLY